MAKIFISYRRKSSAFTLLLANKLSEQLDADIFVDFESIDDDDFESSILKHLRQSDVFLLMVTEHTFADRIHNDKDWVRKEIRTALERDIPIVLVCENGLFPPRDLPDDIRAIGSKQGIEFYPAYFDAAVARLVKFLTKATPVQVKTRQAISQALPVPQERVEDIEIEQSEVSDSNARQILTEALAASDAGDFGQALFLFEALKEIGYQTRFVDIDETMARVEKEHEQQERKRQAVFDYDEIALFANSERNLPQALEAFKEWANVYPEFVEELDNENLRNMKFAPSESIQENPVEPLPEPIKEETSTLEPDETGSQAEVVTPLQPDVIPSRVRARERKQERQQEKKRKQLLIVGGIALVAIIGIVFVAMNILNSETLESAMERAKNFNGTQNSDWIPFEQEFDGVTMVLVPKGCFMMGSDGGSSEVAHQQCIEEPFWIDKTEVAQGDFSRLDGEQEGMPSSLGNNRPVENITWFEALEYCQSRDGSLPTELQWEYAARGVESWSYPWGNSFVGDNVVYNGNSENKTVNVGSHPDGASWVGAMDMSGNVWEWASSLYEDYPYDANDGREDLNEIDAFRVLRGGAWDNTERTFLLSSFRAYGSPDDMNNAWGFRCVRAVD